MTEVRMGFKEVVSRFFDHLTSLRKTLPLLGMVLQVSRRKAKQEFDTFVKENEIQVERDNGSVTFTVPQEHNSYSGNLNRNSDGQVLRLQRCLPAS